MKALELPQRAAHLRQLGTKRRSRRLWRRPDAERARRIGEAGAGLPGMTDRLRGALENLEQPFDPLKIPPGEAALEIAMVRQNQRRETREMRGRYRGAVANCVTVRRLTGDDRHTWRAQIKLRSATGERRHEQPARDRDRRGRGRCLWAVVRVASELSDRPHRDHMGRARGEQHCSRRIAGCGDDADALLFCRGDALLDDRRPPLATEPEACDIDLSLQAIIKRGDEVAAARVGWKPANMQF